jgi:hypothetical protein
MQRDRQIVELVARDVLRNHPAQARRWHRWSRTPRNPSSPVRVDGTHLAAAEIAPDRAQRVGDRDRLLPGRDERAVSAPAGVRRSHPGSRRARRAPEASQPGSLRGPARPESTKATRTSRADIPRYHCGCATGSRPTGDRPSTGAARRQNRRPSTRCEIIPLGCCSSPASSAATREIRGSCPTGSNRWRRVELTPPAVRGLASRAVKAGPKLTPLSVETAAASVGAAFEVGGDTHGVRNQ